MKSNLRPTKEPKISSFSRFKRIKTRITLISRLEKLKNHGQPSVIEKDPYENKNTQALKYKITFSSDEYSYDNRFAPGIAFYKFLAKRSNSNLVRLSMSIPDTIVFNESMIPV